MVGCTYKPWRCGFCGNTRFVAPRSFPRPAIGYCPWRQGGRGCAVASETASQPSLWAADASSPGLGPSLRPSFAKPDSELESLLKRVSAGCGTSKQGVWSSSSTLAAHHPTTAPARRPLIPVYVMLPLDTVWLLERGGGTAQPVVLRENAMRTGLEMLAVAGVAGVMVDVWWGIVEHSGPRRYDWGAYRALFEAARCAGLRIQAVMSFHAAGSNVGDTCTIPLPRWVLEAGDRDPDIFYTDRAGVRNRECLSLGCDEEPVLAGRTPAEAYVDFVTAFAREFRGLLGSTIGELTIGLGPAGEVRYPSYPDGDGRWRFPGIGEFQCYDAYMLRALRNTAETVGKPEWGLGAPADAGGYNSLPHETGFFHDGWGGWETEYGRFFLGWYSGMLLRHADRILGAVRAELMKPGWPRQITDNNVPRSSGNDTVGRRSSVLLGADPRSLRSKGAGVQRQAPGAALPSDRSTRTGVCSVHMQPTAQLGVKLAGVHWGYNTRAHAAELTAGTYNTRHHDGYSGIMAVLAKHGAVAHFTCVEMRDCEHPPGAACGPEGLLQQVLGAAARYGVPLGGENALQRYDRAAFDQMAVGALGKSVLAGRLEKITFLRMGDMMIDNWDAFSGFLQRLRDADHGPCSG